MMESDVEKLVEAYNTTLSSLLDELPPIKRREVTIKPKLAWFRKEHKSNVK